MKIFKNSLLNKEKNKSKNFFQRKNIENMEV